MSDETTMHLKLKPGYWLCIDPGNVKSGWLTCIEDESVMGHLRVVRSGIDPNRTIRRAMAQQREMQKEVTLLMECPKPRGQPTSAEEMETLVEIGRTMQMWRGPWSYIFRQEAKNGIVGFAQAKDKHVSQALKDRFGGEAIAVGGKRCKKCSGTKVVGKTRCPRCLLGTKTNNDCEHCDGGKDKSVYEKETCLECEGSGWHEGRGPGPLHDMSAHKWAALLLGCWWQDSEQVPVHDVAGKQPVKKKRKRKTRTGNVGA